MHPNDEKRLAINYEVIEITMPFVFLGAFIGVKLGYYLGEIPRVVLFGCTVAWSIRTTAQKVVKLRKQEKEKEEKQKAEK